MKDSDGRPFYIILAMRKQLDDDKVSALALLELSCIENLQKGKIGFMAAPQQPFKGECVFWDTLYIHSKICNKNSGIRT